MGFQNLTYVIVLDFTLVYIYIRFNNGWLK